MRFIDATSSAELSRNIVPLRAVLARPGGTAGAPTRRGETHVAANSDHLLCLTPVN
jgi:hypothetical protein